jgi:hypothetical protein
MSRLKDFEIDVQLPTGRTKFRCRAKSQAQARELAERYRQRAERLTSPVALAVRAPAWTHADFSTGLRDD